jgi:hypothetical protein
MEQIASSLPLQPVREEIQAYAECCERLLAVRSEEDPLTDDERWIIRHYMTQLANELKGT